MKAVLAIVAALLLTACEPPEVRIEPQPVQQAAVQETFNEAVPPTIHVRHEDLQCLAINMYHEARGQSYLGRLAVGFVTVNRMRSGDFPDSICHVVYQARYQNNKPLRNQCQFSWYCDGRKDRVRDEFTFAEITDMAYNILVGHFEDVTGGALYFHTRKVHPKWAKKKQFLTQIEDHLFYM